MERFIKLMRVKHYVKNLLLFVPLLFSGLFFSTNRILPAVLGFMSFCFASSAVYIINDIFDAEKDRSHETKRDRPIASGAVSKTSAKILAVIMLFFSLIINFSIYFFTVRHSSWVLLVGYVVLNIAYSAQLKNIPILDVVILASGFLIRVFYGSVVTKIDVSVWLYLTVLMFSFYMSLGKRRNELAKMPQAKSGATRDVLEHYNFNFLDKNMYVCMMLTIVFYSLWTIDDSTMARVGTNALIGTIPLVMIIFMKYNLIIEKDSDGDPIEVLLSNKPLIVLVGLFVLCIGIIFYKNMIVGWISV